MSLRRTRRKADEIDITILEDDDQGIDLVYQRIKAPIIWENLPDFTIQDVSEEYLDQILDLIRNSYMYQEVLCYSINITDDPESVDAYMENIRSVLKDGCSIIAVSKTTNQCVGVMMLKIYSLKDYGKVYSRVRLREGVKFQKILDLIHYLDNYLDIFSYFDVEKYIKIYATSINREYSGQGICSGLTSAAYKIARALKVSVIMGIISSTTLQNKLKRYGMKILFEQYYVDWRDKNGEMIFEDLGAGNYTLAVMAGKVPLRYRAPVSDPSLTGYPSDDDDEEIEIKVISLKIED